VQPKPSNVTEHGPVRLTYKVVVVAQPGHLCSPKSHPLFRPGVPQKMDCRGMCGVCHTLYSLSIVCPQAVQSGAGIVRDLGACAAKGGEVCMLVSSHKCCIPPQVLREHFPDARINVSCSLAPAAPRQPRTHLQTEHPLGG